MPGWRDRAYRVRFPSTTFAQRSGLIDTQPIANPDSQSLRALDSPDSRGQLRAQEPGVGGFVSQSPHCRQAYVDRSGSLGGLILLSDFSGDLSMNPLVGSWNVVSANRSLEMASRSILRKNSVRRSACPYRWQLRLNSKASRHGCVARFMQVS